jgi:hypothetical protein
VIGCNLIGMIFEDGANPRLASPHLSRDSFEVVPTQPEEHL